MTAEERQDADVILTKLSEYFIPRRNKIYESYVFNSHCQKAKRRLRSILDSASQTRRHMWVRHWRRNAPRLYRHCLTRPWTPRTPSSRIYVDLALPCLLQKVRKKQREISPSQSCQSTFKQDSRKFKPGRKKPGKHQRVNQLQQNQPPDELSSDKSVFMLLAPKRDKKQYVASVLVRANKEEKGASTKFQVNTENSCSNLTLRDSKRITRTIPD